MKNLLKKTKKIGKRITKSLIGAPINIFKHVEWPNTVGGLDQDSVEVKATIDIDLDLIELIALPAAKEIISSLPENVYWKRLYYEDQNDLLNHWLGLSKEDLRLRFFHTVSESVLEHRSKNIKYDNHMLLGLYNEKSELISVAEWACENETIAEAAFSTWKEYRGQGLGKRLAALCILDAKLKGMEWVKIESLKENDGATKLALSLGGKIKNSIGQDTNSCYIKLDGFEYKSKNEEILKIKTFNNVS